jgi:hypothetical protein
MILTPAAAFEALSNVSHILFTLNCGEIYPERLLVCKGVGAVIRCTPLDNRRIPLIKRISRGRISHGRVSYGACIS